DRHPTDIEFQMRPLKLSLVDSGDVAAQLDPADLGISGRGLAEPADRWVLLRLHAKTHSKLRNRRVTVVALCQLVNESLEIDQIGRPPELRKVDLQARSLTSLAANFTKRKPLPCPKGAHLRKHP